MRKYELDNEGGSVSKLKNTILRQEMRRTEKKYTQKAH